MVLTCNNRSFLVEQYQILIHISFRIHFLSICRSKSLTLKELPNLLYSLQAINFLNFCLGKWLWLFHYWRTTSFDTEFYTGSVFVFFSFQYFNDLTPLFSHLPGFWWTAGSNSCHSSVKFLPSGCPQGFYLSLICCNFNMSCLGVWFWCLSHLCFLSFWDLCFEEINHYVFNYFICSFSLSSPSVITIT